MKPWIFSDPDTEEKLLWLVLRLRFRMIVLRLRLRMTVYLHPLGSISSFQHYDYMMLIFLLNVLANVKEPAFSRVNACPVQHTVTDDVPVLSLNWY